MRRLVGVKIGFCFFLHRVFVLSFVLVLVAFISGFYPHSLGEPFRFGAWWCPMMMKLALLSEGRPVGPSPLAQSPELGFAGYTSAKWIF
jgi:hypothetical protein